MKRRNFVGISLLLLSSLRAVSAKSKNAFSAPLKNFGPLKIGEDAKTIYLKRSEVVELPENPTPIDTILHFSLKKYRFGKSPVIRAGKHCIDSEKKDEIIVSKDIKLSGKIDFYMQYTGPEVGWIILV